KYCGGVVRSASPECRGLTAFRCRYKAGDYLHVSVFFKILPDVTVGFFEVDTRATEIVVGTDHGARIQKFRRYPTIFEYFVDDICRQPFAETHEDRKSTRLNSSHVKISY